VCLTATFPQNLKHRNKKKKITKQRRHVTTVSENHAEINSNNFSSISGKISLHQTLLFSTKFRLKLNILTVTTLQNGCEVWTVKRRDIRELETAEVQFMTRTTEYNLSDR
jgi:hypothetical protein